MFKNHELNTRTGVVAVEENGQVAIYAGYVFVLKTSMDCIQLKEVRLCSEFKGMCIARTIWDNDVFVPISEIEIEQGFDFSPIMQKQERSVIDALFEEEDSMLRLPTPLSDFLERPKPLTFAVSWIKNIIEKFKKECSEPNSFLWNSESPDS